MKRARIIIFGILALMIVSMMTSSTITYAKQHILLSLQPLVFS